jgi:hypothetical protein
VRPSGLSQNALVVSAKADGLISLVPLTKVNGYEKFIGGHLTGAAKNGKCLY